MTGRIPALVEPALLAWGRSYARLPREIAAKKAGLKPEKLEAIENGKAQASVAQVRKLAHAYQVPFSIFYLPTPPDTHIPEPKDFRRLPDQDTQDVSPELWLEYRIAYERRETLLEIIEDSIDEFPTFDAKAKLTEDPEVVGVRLRDYLGLSRESQSRWMSRGQAFSWVRDAAETHGVLVFQFSSVAISEARGFAIAEFPLPVVAVNRKDSFGRVFSVLHELCHLMLRSTSLSNLAFDFRQERARYDPIEVFCNHVAGAALVPRNRLLAEIEHDRRHWAGDPELLNNDIERLARVFAVSREVVARRLLITSSISQSSYGELRAKYRREREVIEQKPKKKQEGFLPPAQNTVSKAGKLYPRILLDAVSTNRLTDTAASSYLGVKVGQLDKVASLIGQ